MRYFNFILCLFVLNAGTVLVAEDVVKASYETYAIEPSVDTWMRGTVMTINASKGSFTVRGSKDAHAIALSNMLRELDTLNHKDLTGIERRAQEQEIRQKWSPVLLAAKERIPENDSDFVFYIPAKGKTLNVYDESLRAESEVFTSNGIWITRTNLDPITAFGNLAIGDYVAVGYDSGALTNTAFVVLKTQFRKKVIIKGEPEPAAPLPTLVDRADSQIPANTVVQIRDTLIHDQRLSASAKSVQMLRGKSTLTLRGRVASSDEKIIVEQTAANFVGASNVISQLDVR